mmetsp:Transcript_87957/g.188684  ORF Transcript_87957/g.188684 Transcript_87957/m.188684 type:complete len:279 (+) Transcript_87957:1-837(+)
MDTCAEPAEFLGKVVGCFASPIAFPLVYCFPAEGDLGPPWAVSMEEAMLKQPVVCCCSLCCANCVQFWVRRRVLNDDMSKYKCFQGLRDGPYCLATCKPELPFTFVAGTYGEQDCPSMCLCVEVTLCTFCAFQASREFQRNDRGLGVDPTEVRVYRCLDFFGQLAHCLCCVGCCLKCGGCCVECCLGQVEGAQDFADSSQRLGNALLHIAHGIRRGMHWVIVIATGCMSAQMVHESYLPLPAGRGGVDPHMYGMPPRQQDMSNSAFKGDRYGQGRDRA